jgi:hypothetical protein
LEVDRFQTEAEGASPRPTAFSRHVSKVGLLKYVLSVFGPLDDDVETTLREWLLKQRVPTGEQ